ncbi:MAG: hypothetical protein Q7Q73_03920 [Verrucomicrobiota bacterium JB024]|nr:hypothetical protein [Verrucomicrobiota bacterium JB024]
MSNQKDRTPNDILNDLYSFAYGDEETEIITPENALKHVSAAGIDLEKLQRFVEEQACIETKKIKLQKAKLKRQQLLGSTASSMLQAGKDIRSQVQAMIEGIKHAHPQQAAVYFNRFQECDEDDLQTLMDDLQLLQKMDENNDAE